MNTKIGPSKAMLIEIKQLQDSHCSECIEFSQYKFNKGKEPRNCIRWLCNDKSCPQGKGIQSATEIDRVLPNCKPCLAFNPCNYSKPNKRHPENCVSFNAGHGQCKKSDSYKEIFFPREIKDAGF